MLEHGDFQLPSDGRWLPLSPKSSDVVMLTKLIITAMLLTPWASWAQDKDFLWYCESDEATAAQKRTVAALRGIVNLRPDASCEQINDKLQKKAFVNIPGTGVSDLAPLAKFIQIESLNLSYNDITSTSALNNLPALEQLIITNTKITAIPELKASKKLALLNVGFNPIASISDISHLSSLKKLQIDKTAITDLSAIKNDNLLELSLKFIAGEANLASLPTLPKLRELVLDESVDMADLKAVARFTSLRKVSCRYCGITDVAGIAGLSDLRILTLEGNAIKAISTGQLPPSLTSLDVSANPIGDFAFLSELPKLHWTLNLDNTGFHDWRQVMTIVPKLRYFYAAFTPVKEIIVESKSHWPVMTIFDLGGTSVRSLAPLKKVTAGELDNFYGPDFEKVTEDNCPTQGVPDAVAAFCKL